MEKIFCCPGFVSEYNLFFLSSEYKIDVMDEQFNLSYIDINTPNKKYHVDFDA